MKTKVIIAALLLLQASYSKGQDKFEITGKLSEVGKEKIAVLSYKDDEGKDTKDTAIVKNGKFALRGTTAFANRAYLSILPVKKDSTRRTESDYQEFYLEKGKYKVIGTNSMSKASITGTPSQTESLEYKTQMGTMPAQFRALSQEFIKARSAKDEATIKRIQGEAKPLMAKMEAVLDSFVFSHPDSYVSLDLVNDNKTSVIDPETFDPYYKALSSRVLKSFTGQKLTAKYDKAKQLSIGKTMAFTQIDDKGNTFELSSLKGKYVLVDFWASWCAPCRAENPFLLKAYNQLKEKNFEIVGISLDETKAAWLNAVKKDGMPWIQVSDLKGFKNDVAVKYGIRAIPQNVLINPEGVIIAKNLRGEDVDKMLASFVK